MIFLFDKFKKLKGTVRNRHTISLLYERERNGLYTVSAEIPLKITDKKTVYNYHKKVKDSDFLGHYDREGRFQLHKIASVDIEDSSIFIKGVHLFFDEAKAGAIIQERRFRQSEIIDGARAAFDSIGWSVVDFDVSDTEDYIFYNVSPLEARAILVETFGFEFDYWLDFDGKNIRNKQISVKREMGKDSNKRYNYGHNVLNIKVEQDYSEIYTAVIGRGKGEDLGDDAYGRRIEYTDVEWKTPSNPMNKPKGSRVLHDENATQLFGYHEDGKVSPRTKVEIFEDIEDPAKLLRASYNWLRENSVPKAVFSLKVPDGDGLDLGDKVHVIYRDIDLVKHTRVTRVIDDLVSGNRDVEFGDTAYFKTDRRLSGVKSELKRVGGSMSSRISRLKAEFDRRFDNEVQQWKDDFEQALIDAEAAVAVMRAEMTEELATVRREMTNRFESEKAAAQEEAQRNYDAISDRITTVVDTTRTEMNTAFENSVKESKAFATQEAKAKAQEVQSNLESFETRHDGIISDFQNDVSTSFSSINSDILGLAGRVSTAESKLTVQDDEISSIVGKVDGNTKSISAVVQDAKSIKSTIAEIEKDLVSQGSEIDQALDSITNKVWRTDIDNIIVGGTNLAPNTNFESTKYVQGDWGTWGPANIRDLIQAEGYLLTLTDNPNNSSSRTFGLSTPILNKEVVKGKKYTVSFKVNPRVGLEKPFDYMYLMNVDGVVKDDGSTGNSSLPNTKVINEGELRYGTYPVVRHELTFTANFSGRARILIGYTFTPGEYTYMYIKDIKVEEGTKATAYSQAPSDFLQMSGLEITPDYWQLGSTRIDGESVSSVLRGSPDSIDAIVSEMNLTGNLNVKGQIETIAMSAVRGDFAELFADRVKAGDVDIDNISGRTAWFERLYTLNANIEKLTAQIVFTDAIHAKSLDAIEANIGRVRTAFLKADVISGTHIKSNTIEIKHLTGYDAILEMLMARKVFSSEVTTLSLNAVEANIGSLRTQILTSNVIKSSHIAGGTALIDKIFSSTAMFERMMAKSGFVRTLNTVSLHANSFSSSYPGSNREITMENGRARFRYGSIEIQTTSGRRVIIDGSINRSSSMTQRMPAFMSSEVNVNGSWYQNNSSNYQVAHTEYYMHEARYLLVGVALNRWGYSGQGVFARMETRGITSSTFSVSTNGTHYGWLKIDLGEPLDRPTTGEVQISFRKSHSSIAGAVRLHIANRYVTDYPDNI